MRLSRALAVAKRVFRQIKHDRRTMGMIVFTPLAVMLICGYSFEGKVIDVRVVVVNHDGGFGGMKLSENVIGHIDKEVLSLEYSDDEDEVKHFVRDGKSWAAIIFPTDFTKNVITRHVVEILVSLDGSDPTVANAILTTLRQAGMKTMDDIGIEAQISIDTDFVYGGEDIKFIDFFAPGIICATVMALSMLLTLISLVRERTRGTLDRMLASPITEGEIVVGYALTFLIIGLVQSSILLTMAVIFFGISVHGSMAVALLIIVLSALGYQTLGMVLSVVAKTEFQAAQFMPLIFLPSMLLAGVFWPLEAMPTFIRPISYIIPLTYAAKALRSVTIRAWGLEKIWGELTVLCIFTIIMVFLSLAILKRRK